jgi:hypothetical protein
MVAADVTAAPLARVPAPGVRRADLLEIMCLVFCSVPSVVAGGKPD